MTTPQPFTPAGVAAKLNDLYALSDPALAAEAAAVKADFQQWVEDNFTLDTEQTAFLNNMDSAATSYLGAQSAFCFIHRLQIILVKPAPPGTAYAKWVETVDAIQTTIHPVNGFTASGTFTIEIVYG